MPVRKANFMPDNVGKYAVPDAVKECFFVVSASVVDGRSGHVLVI